MRVAQIVNGVVVNVIEVDPASVPAFAVGWPEAPTAAPGDHYAKGVFSPPAQAIDACAVDAERDQRLARGFVFQGKRFDCDGDSLSRITRYAMLAGLAIGSPVGNYRWHGGTDDFAWIAQDNSLTVMDAQTCLAFGRAAIDAETAHVFAARALKDANPIPADFREDRHWPKSH